MVRRAVEILEFCKTFCREGTAPCHDPATSSQPTASIRKPVAPLSPFAEPMERAPRVAARILRERRKQARVEFPHSHISLINLSILAIFSDHRHNPFFSD